MAAEKLGVHQFRLANQIDRIELATKRFIRLKRDRPMRLTERAVPKTFFTTGNSAAAGLNSLTRFEEPVERFGNAADPSVP